MIPSAVAAAGWIPFTIMLVLCFIFSALYVCYFWNRHDKDLCSAIVGTFALFLVLLTVVLFPVDIFLVSYMKYPNGTFREWATNETIQSLGDSVNIVYYTLYSLMLFFIFILLPFVYFFYEEKDDDISGNLLLRFSSSLKYTMLFIIFASVLLLIGTFVPMETEIPHNSTEWEKVEFLFDELVSTKGERGLCFILAVLSSIGMCSLILYTGFGMCAGPVGMIRGNSSTKAEHEAVRKRYERTQAEISSLQRKGRYRQLSSRDRTSLAELEETERLIQKEDHYLTEIEQSCVYKCRNIIRPLQVVFGVVGIAFGFLFWISLLLTNIDRIKYADPKTGYSLTEQHIVNPLDFLLIQSQKVFPVDYILFLLVVAFLVIFTISGIQYLGLWFFFLRLYKILHRHTKPQGIILLCGVLMFSVLAIQIAMHQTASQYTMYGSQHYFVANVTSNSTSGTVYKCNVYAPAGECLLTKGSVFLMRFIYKMWFFGALYYWASWFFLVVTVISFGVCVLRRRYSSIHGLVERDSIDESDDELIQS